MIVRDVKEIARDWIELYAGELPGFQSAILAGSINWMADDEPWPPTSDVDVWGVLDVEAGFNLDPYHLRFDHIGLIVDFAALPGSRFRDWQEVVSTYWLACHVAADSVLVDRSGNMRSLQEQVLPTYRQRQWVQMRLQDVVATQDAMLDGLTAEEPQAERGRLLSYSAIDLGHMLLVANLGNPTLRKLFVLTHELLEKQCRSDLHEAMLSVIGCQDLDGRQIEYLFGNLIEAFECSSRVALTRFNQDHYTHEVARRAVIDGTRELIDAGYGREAVGWMLMVRPLCQTAIDFDASDEEKAYFGRSYSRFLNTSGLNAMADYEKREALVRSLRPEVMQIAEQIMDSNQLIT